MSEALDRLTAEVAEMRAATDAAAATIADLRSQLQASGNEAELNALADDLDAQQAALAGAVAGPTVSPVDDPVEEPAAGDPIFE